MTVSQISHSIKMMRGVLLNKHSEYYQRSNPGSGGADQQLDRYTIYIFARRKVEKHKET